MLVICTAPNALAMRLRGAGARIGRKANRRPGDGGAVDQKKPAVPVRDVITAMTRMLGDIAGPSRARARSQVCQPPYTKEEIDDFYRRVGKGPLAVLRGANAAKKQKSPPSNLPGTEAVGEQ